ncbi:hypothetical protein GS425_17315 [Rhodococcus hoagii]|nr:hypothetical protein [Prescottella equi]
MSDEKSKELRTKLLGYDPDLVKHPYPEGMTLRDGVVSMIAGLQVAQAFVATQMQQGVDEVAQIKGGTMLSVYEATILDLQALLDHHDATEILNGDRS